MAGTSPAMTPERARKTFGAGLGLVHSAASLIACDGGDVSSPAKAAPRTASFNSATFAICFT